MASQSSKFATMKDFNDNLANLKQEELMTQFKKYDEERLKEIQKDIEEKKYEEALGKDLPMESEGGKKKRLEKEKEERYKLEMAKKKKQQKPLPFGHRRNGGGKHRTQGVAAPEVIKDRKAAKRRERKVEKKQEAAAQAQVWVSQAKEKNMSNQLLNINKELGLILVSYLTHCSLKALSVTSSGGGKLSSQISELIAEKNISIPETSAESSKFVDSNEDSKKIL